MSDGTRLNEGVGGDLIYTEDVIVEGKFPVTKLRLGADGADDGDVSSANPLPVTGTITVEQDTAANLKAEVSGSVSVSNFPATQPVSGTFWPVTQPVSGSVSVSNLPATQPVSGSVSVSNFPSSQVVAGGGTAGSPGSAVLTVQGISGGTPQPVSGSGTFTVAGAGTAGSPGSAVLAVQGVSGGTAQNVVGTGTAGSPGTAVLTVQGITNGTAQPVSGTVNVVQSVASNLVATVQGNGSAGTPHTGVVTVQGITNGTAIKVDGSATPVPIPASANVTGLSSKVLSNAGGSTVSSVKTASGRLYGWQFYNPNGSLVYIQLFDALSPTVGTTAPLMSLFVPPSGGIDAYLTVPVSFTNGLTFSATTTQTGGTAPASAVTANVLYL